MPCIRIGYNDILGGQSCGANEPGTCADELDAFINVDNLLSAGIQAAQFEIYYKVEGGEYATNGWKKYDWQNCGQYANHCIRLKGAGVVYARTKIIGGTSIPTGSYSLTNQMPFDTGAPRTQ
jgi:hypothetical protein